MRRVLMEASKRTGIDVNVLEKDWTLGWVLYGLAHVAEWNEHFLFKGGTAIKKVYIPQHRFSEDLDWTLVRAIPLTDLRQWLQAGLREAQRFGPSFGKVEMEKTTRGTMRIKVEYRGPMEFGRADPPKIRIEITPPERELVVDAPQRLPIIHEYPDKVTAHASVYTLEEILGEKMRALVERVAARDLYDIWQLMAFHRNRFDLARTVKIFYKKALHRGLDPKLLGARLTGHGICSEARWQDELRNQIKAVPALSDVLPYFRTPTALAGIDPDILTRVGLSA